MASTFFHIVEVLFERNCVYRNHMILIFSHVSAYISYVEVHATPILLYTCYRTLPVLSVHMYKSTCTLRGYCFIICDIIMRLYFWILYTHMPNIPIIGINLTCEQLL